MEMEKSNRVCQEVGEISKVFNDDELAIGGEGSFDLRKKANPFALIADFVKREKPEDEIALAIGKGDV